MQTGRNELVGESAVRGSPFAGYRLATLSADIPNSERTTFIGNALGFSSMVKRCAKDLVVEIASSPFQEASLRKRVGGQR